jgi:hypothetical protein
MNVKLIIFIILIRNNDNHFYFEYIAFLLANIALFVFVLRYGKDFFPVD